MGTLMVILYLVMNPISIMKASKRRSPSSLKIPDRMGASLISSNGPPRSPQEETDTGSIMPFPHDIHGFQGNHGGDGRLNWSWQTVGT